MSNSSVIDSESESVWCYILKMCLFYVKDLFKMFFLCDCSAILTKLTEFYYFLIDLGLVCSYFRLKRCF